jgi:hypothetical protein
MQRTTDDDRSGHLKDDKRLLLGQVNVFNEIDRRLAGSVAVAGPDDESHLDETFELISSRTDTGDGQSFATHDDLGDGPGAYEVTVELDSEVGRESRAAETVEIETSDEQRLAVESVLPTRTKRSPSGSARASVSSFRRRRRIPRPDPSGDRRPLPASQTR